jgi:ADP-heptose:LPS heptosyltransferase
MDLVWVINKGDRDIDHCLMDEKRWIVFHPNRPQQVLQIVALDLIKSYRTLRLCDNPEKYFPVEKPMRVMIQRDGGIGDLLLLEPVLRAMKDSMKCLITVHTMQTDVFDNNPIIDHALSMAKKDDNLKIEWSKYDQVVDYRNWSEVSGNRGRLHRTDVYAEKTGINLTGLDLEPKLFFKMNEKNEMFVREEGKTYIGVQLDASHDYRRYDNGLKLVEALLTAGYIPVVMGGWDFVRPLPDSAVDLQGKTTVRQAINVIRDLDYFIGVDSGLLHVALTLHVPSVAIYSIITPALRLKYYTGPYKVIAKGDCIGCGNEHMQVCKHGDKTKDKTPPCMQIEPSEIIDAMKTMGKVEDKRMFYSIEKAPAVIDKSKSKIWMPIIVQNEEKNLPRFIELVMSHPLIEKVIAIDGGSTDGTVELLKKAGALVYTHFYDKDFLDMQAMQRNYSCAFVPDGRKIIIMDIDECLSDELYEYLFMFAESRIDFATPSRRTFNYFADIKDPSKRVKDYPDYQPRLFTWNRKFKWVGSPHHAVLNTPNPVRVDKDIIHFEREGKDRDALELKWAEMNNRTKEVYG